MLAIIFAKNSMRLADKHMRTVCGRPMISFISDNLYNSGIFSEIILFTKNEYINSDNCETVPDKTSGVLIDSIAYCIKEYGTFFAIGGDMPLVDRNLINKLFNNYSNGIRIGKNYGNIQPLFSIYSQIVYENLIKSIKNDEKSMYRFLNNHGHNFIDIDSIRLKSVNYNYDLLFARKFLGCSYDGY